ncbi:LOW QUALITY PROTEIN: WAP four-disulfide core domain protein 3 [Aplochiton taeniatus]
MNSALFSTFSVFVVIFAHFSVLRAIKTEGDVRAKPGVCPHRKWGVRLMCAEFCSNDSDCPNNEKCCCNGCGHECITPYTVKSGRCGLPKGTTMCAEYCYHDGQCPGEQKCCRTTCGHACTEPC